MCPRLPNNSTKQIALKMVKTGFNQILFFNCEELERRAFPTFKNNILESQIVMVCKIISERGIRKYGDKV